MTEAQAKEILINKHKYGSWEIRFAEGFIRGIDQERDKPKKMDRWLKRLEDKNE